MWVDMDIAMWVGMIIAMSVDIFMGRWVVTRG